MGDNNKYSEIVLSDKTYRNLQQMAKSMSLPSNVKKKYLIELIVAKKFKSAKELDEIIHRVKQERLQLSKAKKGKARKNSVQGTEISSTSNSSPPISSTPKVLKRNALMTYTNRNSLDRFKSFKTFKSDRVLRSFTRPNYRIYNMNNTVIGLIKGEEKNARINIISQDGRPKFNVTAVLKNVSDPVSSSQLMSFCNNKSPQPDKRSLTNHRKPLTPTVNITSRDGRTAKINALVHKPTDRQKPYRFSEMSLLKTNLKEHPNYDLYKPGSSNEGNCDFFEKSKENFSNVKDKGLPRITEVFSKFSGVQHRNLMQPIYVQVSEDSERTTSPIYTASVSQSNTSLLEKLYNFKDQFITNRPLNPLNCAKAKTQCVFSTPTITTPLACTLAFSSQHPTVAGFNDFNACYGRDSSYQSLLDTLPRSYQMDDDTIFSGKDFNCDEVLSSSSSSIDTLSCDDLAGNVSIPEMVEDALELISQDGDYMERIGMNDKMLCLICSWSGPKLMLEHHVRKDHSSDIYKSDNPDWNVTFTLGSVVQRDVWLCRLFEYDDMIYVVSAKYEDPDRFMATLHSLSTDETCPQTGSMTIYNKVTGEPYSWEGDINELPDGIPYTNDSECLKLSLAKMNLLPNSANLQLINRELVVKSPSKVVVGQPELNEIHIILFVKVVPIPDFSC